MSVLPPTCGRPYAHGERGKINLVFRANVYFLGENFLCWAKLLALR